MKNIIIFMIIVLFFMFTTKIVRAEYKPADTILEKKLKVNYPGGEGCYELRPRDAFTTVISEYAIAEIKYCNSTDTSWSFDVNGRISTVINGVDYCLTAPGSVISGKVVYDNVRALRCDMGNRAQKWYVSEDNHITSFIGNYKMEGYHGLIYISNNESGFYPLTIPKEMNDWIENLSIPRTYNFALSMNWKLDNVPYYANYRADSYSSFRSISNNSYRVLYSPYTKLLTFQHSSGANESVAYCLKSNNKKDDNIWEYTEISSYTQCPKVGSELIPQEMQWDMVVVDLPDDKKKQALVNFYDQWGNALKVWSSSGAWGLTFTAPNNSMGHYPSITQESTGSFYVNREAAEWRIFDSANQQERAQYCPAPTVAPHQKADKSIYEQKSNKANLLPIGFRLTEEWYSRLFQIAISPRGQVPGVGICGVCLLEAIEILREFYESDEQMQPTGNGHYFDPNLQVSCLDQFANNDPNIYLSLETIWQAVNTEMSTLQDLYSDGHISERRYIDEFRARLIESIRTAINELLPDFYQTAPAYFTFRGYSVAFRDGINNYFSQSAVGTTAILSSQVSLISGGASGHSVPLVRLDDGWVMLEVSVPGGTQARIDRYNRARFATPAEAIFNYYQTRYPFYINGQNNIDFSDVGNTLLVTQVNQRPSVIVRNPTVSFGNCSGEGEDGRRGTGTQTEARDFVQNVCEIDHTYAARCYGASSSSEDIIVEWPPEYLNLNTLSPNGKATQVQMHNKGAYYAMLTIKYYEFVNRKWVSRTRKTSTASGGTAVIDIPADVKDVSVTGMLRTGIVWKPVRQIFYANLCHYNNQWFSKSLNSNIVRINVGGTTFNSNWRFLRPSGTINNEVNTDKSCDY